MVATKNPQRLVVLLLSAIPKHSTRTLIKTFLQSRRAWMKSATHERACRGNLSRCVIQAHTHTRTNRVPSAVVNNPIIADSSHLRWVKLTAIMQLFYTTHSHTKRCEISAHTHTHIHKSISASVSHSSIMCCCRCCRQWQLGVDSDKPLPAASVLPNKNGHHSTLLLYKHLNQHLK